MIRIARMDHPSLVASLLCGRPGQCVAPMQTARCLEAILCCRPSQLATSCLTSHSALPLGTETRAGLERGRAGFSINFFVSKQGSQIATLQFAQTSNTPPCTAHMQQPKLNLHFFAGGAAMVFDPLESRSPPQSLYPAAAGLVSTSWCS